MTFTTERRVEFHETDAAGIAHFSAYFPMMEAAEHEMLRSLGISVLPHPGENGADQPGVTWPRIAASCNFFAAARFEDVLQIAVGVAHIGTTSVQYRFDFTRDGQPIAEGTITVVCCRMPEDRSPVGQGLAKTPIPAAIRQLLAQHQ